MSIRWFYADSVASKLGTSKHIAPKVYNTRKTLLCPRSDVFLI